ncbi:DUF551 domain-containing protein [Escherichia coli]|nr:DUF551 domain-containing protein [Escherichia coli]
MITITKERLLTIKRWRETYGPGSNVVLPAEEAEELARIALASLEAEKVTLYRERNPYNGMTTGWQELTEQEYEFVKDNASENAEFRTVYTAPPAPVIQADVAQAIENLKQKLVECNRYNYCADAVKGVEDACHAAMLQGSQPASQTYKLPVNTPCQDAPAHIWLQTAGVWPEDGELSELTWCSHNQHHDDTLFVRADLVNGNYPVTPDSWISCSERMPEDGQHVIILCDGAFVLYAQYRDGEFFDVVRNGEEFFETQSRNVTHWMPLPAAPQQEMN